METKTGSGKGKNMHRSFDIGKSHGLGALQGRSAVPGAERQMSGTWVAWSFGHPTLDFGSGDDLMVCDFKLCVRALH